MADPIEDLARRTQRALVAADLDTQASLIRAYGKAYERTLGLMDDLLADIDKLRAAGTPIDAAMVRRLDSFQRYNARLISEIAGYADEAEQLTLFGERAAIQRGVESARTMLQTLGGTNPSPLRVGYGFGRVPTRATLEAIERIKAARAGKLMSQLAPGVAQRAERAIVNGVLQGRPTQAIARELRKATGWGLSKSMTVARTEVLNSYRESTRATYRENSDVLEGWVWRSALDSRTDGFCYSMHGQVFDLDEEMDTHPNCRCTMLPRTKSWAELTGDSSIPETRPDVPTGEDKFAELSPARQREILGPSKFEKYQDGASLADLT